MRPSNWRAVLAAFDPAGSRGPVTLHAAQLLMAKGKRVEAIGAFREFLVRFPEHHGALIGLASLLRRLGRGDEAAEVFLRATKVEAARFEVPVEARERVEKFLSAAARLGPTPDKAPAAYVAGLFDEDADRFDELLRVHLVYRGPELLLEAVTRVLGREPHDLDILDLGCGTGLAGVAFRPYARRLVGVDLSLKMLERATAKGVYDELAEGDVVEHLSRHRDGFDLILAADVFVYLGDLAPVFAAARLALREAGSLAFTVEAGSPDGTEYELQAVRRYSHPRAYLARAAGEAGLAIQYLEEASTRNESTFPVRSLICVLSKEPL